MRENGAHGTISEYNNHRCRCERCKRAWNAYMRRRRVQSVLGEDDPRHGKYTTYGNYACRCDACRAAWAEFYGKNRRRRAEEAREARQAAG